MKKYYYRTDNIGKAKYTVSSHDGIQTHKDGSPFYGIAIFKNKKKLAEHIKQLEADGYKEIGRLELSRHLQTKKQSLCKQ